MPKSLFGVAGTAVLALVAFAPDPAHAQGLAITIGTPGYYAPPAPVYRAYPSTRRVYYRPAPPPYRVRQPAYYAPRCTTRITRHWDGWEWVARRTRICD